MADIKGETIALAALFQCCAQISRVANTGYMDEHAAAAVVRGLLVTNPQSVEDIYSPGRLMTGFKQLVDSFDRTMGNKTSETIAITQNALKIIALEINISRNSAIFNRMGSEIDRLYANILAKEPDYLEASPEIILDNNYLKDFSNLYQSLISPNFPKLIIYGEEQYLSNPVNQDRIRALLLSGIRAVVLWRQLGGRRRFLFFRRKAIVECARKGATSGILN